MYATNGVLSFQGACEKGGFGGVLSFQWGGGAWIKGKFHFLRDRRDPFLGLRPSGSLK